MTLYTKVRRLFPDPRWEVPRFWSNERLRRFAPGYTGSVVNVSAWRDEDKEGRRYRDYFISASDYWVTNYRADARGWQGDKKNEIYLDLVKPLSEELVGRFDVVFNHTTLEHVFDVASAFSNLCAMSRDTVIVIVPFLQEQHGEYGDFWRFTPLAVKQLFEKYGMNLIFLDFNDGRGDAVYVLAIASRHEDRWSSIRNDPTNRLAEVDRLFIGTRVVKRSPVVIRLFKRWLNRVGHGTTV